MEDSNRQSALVQSSTTGHPASNGQAPSNRVSPDRRFRKGRTCPICGGSDDDRRGAERRCYGFLSEDGQYAHCTRQEHAGRATYHPGSETYGHRLKGECPCGVEHGPADPKPIRRPRSGPKSSPKVVVAIYDYTDGGEVLYQSVRYDPKDFRQRRPDGKGGFLWNLDGVRRVLYRREDIRHAPDPARTVFVCEGEKDVNALVARDRIATCNVGGAGKWSDDYSPDLKGRNVVILPHNDEAGRDHAEKVARSVAPHAASVKLLDLVGACKALGLGELPEKGDVSDFLDMGGTVEQLDRLAAEGGTDRAGSAPGGVFPEFSGPPRPVLTTLRPVPEFDPEMLPEALRGWAADIADRMQCSPEFVAVGLVIVLAVLIGRKVGIRPKRHDVWTVVPNLWGLIVGRPGVLKTPALEEALRALQRLAAQAREQHESRMLDYERELLVAEVRKKAAKDALEKSAKKGADQATLMKLAGEAMADAGLTLPVPRRYVTNDCTVEKLGELLGQNPNGLLLYRDELPGFLRSLDKQGHESDRSFYLESWNGTGSFTYDRIGRGTVHIEAVCLSILGGIQPGPLASYLRSSMAGSGDDGLISRFQLAVYPNQDRPFKVVDRLPKFTAKSDADSVFRAIDGLDAPAIGAESDEHSAVPFLHFEPAAQAYFYEWFAGLETKLRADESPHLESHLAKYRSLMPSLALLFHVVQLVNDKAHGPVTLAAARLAAAWCAFLEEHARRIYQAGTDGDMQPARTLAERIAESLPNPFKARDVQRKGWGGLTTADDVDRALGILEEHGWIAPSKVLTTAKGGQPTVEYHVNPALLSPVENPG